jgi:lysophospholipase L1-like esterase
LTVLEPGWRVSNRGVNGQRSDEIRARFRRDALDEAPDVIVLIAGVNDIDQGLPAAAVIEQLGAMYEMAAGLERPIPLVAGSILPYNTASAAEIKAMSEVNRWIRGQQPVRRAFVFCDTRVAVARAGDPDRLQGSPDGLHPDPDGYRRMADTLAPAIRLALLMR